MKKFVVLAVLALLVAGFATSEAGGTKVRLGGGMIFEDSTFGGGAAFDIGIGDLPVGLTPFVEYYKDSGVSTITAGADILYKAPIADGKAEVYIGAGGGYIKVSNGASESNYMIDARGGLDYGITDQIGIFGEVKYLYSSKETNNIKTLDLSNVGALVGISFSIGGN